MQEIKRPLLLEESTRWQLSQLKNNISDHNWQQLSAPAVLHGLKNLFGVSQYSARVCLQWPDILLQRIKDQSITQPYSEKKLTEEINIATANIKDEAALMKALRLLRHGHMLRILWRDANQIAPITQTIHELSQLAEVCIESALQWLYQKMIEEFGTPYVNDTPQKMVILGMGKLGGKELNFSSDVDLIFCFPAQGTTQGSKNSVENQWFFNRLGQSLVRTLSNITVEGFVYRLDLRLRPYGSKSSLSWSFSAMEQYYQDQGRDWERYALIKARPVAGDKKQGFLLLKMLKPFIYRRYLDFSMIESLREMKALVHKEVTRKGMQNDIKMGPGGIREIEFITQSFQLIYGGKKHQLQGVSLLHILKNLHALKFLSQDEAQMLKDAYLFLRRTEHLIQAWEDQQTQTLPCQQEARQALSWAMGYSSWETFYQPLQIHTEKVASLFLSLLSDREENPDLGGSWQLVWEKKIGESESIDLLTQHGFTHAKEVYHQLMLLRNSGVLKSVSRKSITRIHNFMPILMYACESQASPEQAILRILPVVRKVLRRTSYLVLLLERPDALFSLVKLCHDSAWVAGEITRYPALIDEFLNPGNLYNPPPPERLGMELADQLEHIPMDDIEIRLESLCYFKISHLLKSVVAQTNGLMSLMAVSNYLTWVAESIIREIVKLSWHIMITKYGHPAGCQCEDIPPFAVLGYGKVGALEMGPSSDLDLVFIHNTDIQGVTSGANSIDNQTFFARFGQKVIHLLTTQTSLGKLYEVDVRLRPSGHSGLLVSSLNAFSRYHHEEAWTWEAQALIKARVIYGQETAIATGFHTVRKDILGMTRNEQTLANEIKAMREKMLTLDHAPPDLFDLKYGRGGMVDIEFLVQYLVLKWAANYPSLLEWTDNIRILDTLDREHLLKNDESALLQNIYLVLRNASHQQVRQNQNNMVDKSIFVSQRKTVIRLWNKYLCDRATLHPPKR